MFYFDVFLVNYLNALVYPCFMDKFDFIDWVVGWLYRYITPVCILGTLISAIMINDGKWVDGYYTSVSYVLLGLFGVFITVVLIARLQKRIVNLRKQDIAELRRDINDLHKEELKQSTKISRKIEICDIKKDLYEELNNLQNRNMTRCIIGGILALILFLIIQPFKVFLSASWAPLSILFLQILFWYAVYNLVHLLIMFYDATA